MNVERFIQKAHDTGLTFEIVQPGDTGYDDSRTIANSRFDFKPAAIAYCENATHVAFCINYCREGESDLKPVPFRVRSGGHQHEGMCSADDVLMIDLSKINQMTYEENDQAWIPAGKRLSEAYKELSQKDLILPGGGCGSVNVGGLTQGGGWGLHARKWGLTCDNVLAIEMVTARGKHITVSKNNHPHLFEAVRGSGGGNFGIVTRFLFQLRRPASVMTSVRIHWAKKDMEVIAKTMFEFNSRIDQYKNLTTFLRLTAMDTSEESPKNVAVLFGGFFYGAPNELYEILSPFYKAATPLRSEFKETFHLSKNQFFEQDSATPAFSDAFGFYDLHEDISSFLLNLPSIAPERSEKRSKNTPAPRDTCDAPHPHKVSSAFPKPGIDYGKLAKVITAYINTPQKGITKNEKVCAYLSIHSMGGAITEVPTHDTAFYFRDKPFLLQPQAWWGSPTDPEAPKYIQWIDNFRKTLDKEGLTEGAFINFVDREVPLVAYYRTQENLNHLGAIKQEYDQDNLFKFDMSIPQYKPNHGS